MNELTYKFVIANLVVVAAVAITTVGVTRQDTEPAEPAPKATMAQYRSVDCDEWSFGLKGENITTMLTCATPDDVRKVYRFDCVLVGATWKCPLADEPTLTKQLHACDAKLRERTEVVSQCEGRLAAPCLRAAVPAPHVPLWAKNRFRNCEHNLASCRGALPAEVAFDIAVPEDTLSSGWRIGDDYPHRVGPRSSRDYTQ